MTMVIITSGLVTVMPRTGGGYVFTSRITHPLLGWAESWGVIMASLALIGFVAVLLVSQIRAVGNVLAAAFPSTSAFHGASTWLTSPAAGFVTGLIVLALAGGIAVLRPRAFFRVLSWTAGIALAAMLLMVIVVPITVDPGTLAARLPRFAGGATVHSIIRRGSSQAGEVETTRPRGRPGDLVQRTGRGRPHRAVTSRRGCHAQAGPSASCSPSQPPATARAGRSGGVGAGCRLVSAIRSHPRQDAGSPGSWCAARDGSRS